MTQTYVQFLHCLNYGEDWELRYDEHQHAIVSVKTADVQNKLTNIGFTQDLVRDFGFPTELSIPCNHWTALRCTSDFANSMSEILEELRAQELLLLNPTSRIDIKSALDLFEFPTYIKDLILDFTAPMLPSVMAQELFQQRKRWKNHDKLLSYVASCEWIEQEYRGYDYKLKRRFKRGRDRYSLSIYLNENYDDYWPNGFRQYTFQSIEDHWLSIRETERYLFQPSQWNEYIRQVGMKRFRNKSYRPRKFKLKFTSGPTLREAIHQDVHNDVKIMVSDMVKEAISFLQLGCRFWASNVLANLKFCGKEWRVMHGGLKAFRVDMPEDENASREKDCFGLGELSCPGTSSIGEIDSDPIKAARKIKWQRTKENSQRKRRQKYEKDRKFRRNRVHNKAWATKVSRA